MMMWLLVSLLALLAFALTDLLGKKKVDRGDAAVPMGLLLSVMVLAFIIGVALFASGVGESGLPPWQILLQHPMIILSSFSFTMYWLLYLYSFRYIGLTWEAAVSGVQSILYFAGLVLVHFFSCKLVSVGDILCSARLIPILLILVFSVLLPNVELIALKMSGKPLEKAKRDRHKAAAGLLILLLALTFDAGDTLITTLVFDDGSIGIMDYLIANYFAAILPIILFSLILRKKTGKCYIPFKDGCKYSIPYAFLAVSSSLLYLSASSLDAVKTGIIFIAAPVFPLICARIFLKERYTWRQNLCIWVIMLAAAAFCAADYIL